ncbi:hypothetical protein MRX96_000922 [Rhipicephalus microplus]
MDIEAIVEAKVLSIIETKAAALVDSQLTATVEPQRTSAVESTLKALVLAKSEPISAQIGDTFMTLGRRMDTHTAQINDLKSQLTNFVVHLKNNCISHVELEDCHDRKKSPKRKKVSHSFSPDGEQVNVLDIHEDGRL